jgi:E3 ubiquitin-protein ligase UBR4
VKFTFSEDHEKHDEALCYALVQLVSRSIDCDLLINFIRWFLLESNSSSVRWQAHSLVLHIYRNSTLPQQEALLDQMWCIWPDLPVYGRKAAQFVDLLGYFAINTPQTSEIKVLCDVIITATTTNWLMLKWLAADDQV